MSHAFPTPARRAELHAVLDLDALEPGLRKLVEAVADRPDLPERLARMALTFRSPPVRPDGTALADAARALAPHDRLVAELTDWSLRRQVPFWHFPLVNDEPRNLAYAHALNRWVEPGMTVLEIGTGTGLLAMLAAKAGAEHVYTCEREPLVAEAAREIIARNGLAGRITVINKDVMKVRVGRDIPERADLFVAEIVDNRLLAEGVLPLTEHARTHLLKPGAPLLPHTIAAIGCLAAGDPAELRMGHTLGFDLTPFNRFAPLTHNAGVGGGSTVAMSEARELLVIELDRDQPGMAAPRNLTLTADTTGRVDGVLRWHRLDFGHGIHFENRPPQVSSWHPQLHLFREPRQVSAGEEIALTIFHDRERITIDAAAP